MNRQIIKLFGFIVVLFAILIGFTSWWSVFDAKTSGRTAQQAAALRAAADPPRRILARRLGDREVGAGRQGDEQAVRAPLPAGLPLRPPESATAFMEQGQSEFEKFHNEELTGEESEFGSILDQLSGTKQEGEQVVTKPRPARPGSRDQRARRRGLRAVVAIEPSTGAVKVLTSNPSYNPNAIPEKLEQWNLAKPRRRSSTGRPSPAIHRGPPSRW